MSYDPIFEESQTFKDYDFGEDPSIYFGKCSSNKIRDTNSPDRLPKNMFPDKKKYELLGFSFEDEGDKFFYKASLPDGWKLKSISDYWSHIIDEKGNHRGNIFYKLAKTRHTDCMYLFPRYKIAFNALDPEDYLSFYRVYVENSDSEVIYIAGICEFTGTEEFNLLIQKAKSFLEKNFPDWEDVTKYWD